METALPAVRVRIVMRTHDRPTLLRRALDDVLAQTYRGWELVILNHRGDRGVLDATVASRVEDFPRPPRVIDTDHPIGRDAILNLGLIDPDLEYLAIHDDDDTWSPAFLAETVAWLDEHADQVAVAVTTEIVEERVDDDGVEVLRTESIRPPFARISLFDLIHAAHIPPIGLLLRSDAIASVGGFDESLSVLGDWDLVLRLATAGDIGYIDGATLAYWRQRPQGAGPLANSVIGDLELHRRTDRELRDRALRDYVDRNGIGGLLYISRFMDEQFAAARHDSWTRAREVESALNSRLDERTVQLEAAIAQYAHHYSLFPSLRRAVRRFLPGRPRGHGAQSPE